MLITVGGQVQGYVCLLSNLCLRRIKKSCDHKHALRAAVDAQDATCVTVGIQFMHARLLFKVVAIPALR